MKTIMKMMSATAALAAATCFDMLLGTLHGARKQSAAMATCIGTATTTRLKSAFQMCWPAIAAFAT